MVYASLATNMLATNMYEGETNVEDIAYIRKQVNMDNLVEK